jgi:hypothetical protein
MLRPLACLADRRHHLTAGTRADPRARRRCRRPHGPRLGLRRRRSRPCTHKPRRDRNGHRCIHRDDRRGRMPGEAAWRRCRLPGGDGPAASHFGRTVRPCDGHHRPLLRGRRSARLPRDRAGATARGASRHRRTRQMEHVGGLPSRPRQAGVAVLAPGPVPHGNECWSSRPVWRSRACAERSTIRAGARLRGS